MNSHSQNEDVSKVTQGETLSDDDYALSLLIAIQNGTVWGHCYENAYSTFFAFPTIFEPGGLFVEGWLVYADDVRVVLMEHGWLISGRYIIDPTIVLGVEFGQHVYYFPGVFRARPELEELENELLPAVRFSTYGDDGMMHSGYRAAYEAALQKARTLVMDGKTFVEVNAAVLAPQDEKSQNEASGFTMIFVVPDQRNGGEPYGQEERG